jgi:hypothetical protein
MADFGGLTRRCLVALAQRGDRGIDVILVAIQHRHADVGAAIRGMTLSAASNCSRALRWSPASR